MYYWWRRSFLWRARSTWICTVGEKNALLSFPFTLLNKYCCFVWFCFICCIFNFTVIFEPVTALDWIGLHYKVFLLCCPPLNKWNNLNPNLFLSSIHRVRWWREWVEPWIWWLVLELRWWSPWSTQLRCVYMLEVCVWVNAFTMF